MFDVSGPCNGLQDHCFVKVVYLDKSRSWVIIRNEAIIMWVPGAQIAYKEAIHMDERCS